MAKILETERWVCDGCSTYCQVAVPTDNTRSEERFKRKDICLCTADEIDAELNEVVPSWHKHDMAPGAVKAMARAGVTIRDKASGEITYSDLLKPENGKLLQEYLYNRREELQAMRKIFFGKE